MYRLRRTAVFLAATTGLTVAATGIGPAQGASATARALKPGQWTQVTGKLSNINDVGLARGQDGVLHVLWTSGSTGQFQVADTPISAAGVVGKPVTIQSHIFAATDPDATVTSAGLAVFWNGVRSSGPNSPTGTFEATRPSRGGTWTVGSVTPATFSWDHFVSASAGPTGSAWTDFGTTGSGIVVHHFGHAPAELTFSTCCVTSEGIGTDSKTGTAWVTYLSLRPHHPGIFAQRVTAAGKASGAPILLPTSNNGGSALPISQRITATGLGGKRAGVYVSYRTGSPETRAVNLLKLGSAHPLNIAKFNTVDDAGGSTLAVDPFGRVWVAWYRLINNRSALWVRRAKSGASNFGRTDQIKLPAGVHNIWKVYISAQAKKLDIVALMTINGKAAYWTTQVLPPRQN